LENERKSQIRSPSGAKQHSHGAPALVMLPPSEKALNGRDKASHSERLNFPASQT
jgi:hypothetical protein